MQLREEAGYSLGLVGELSAQQGEPLLAIAQHDAQPFVIVARGAIAAQSGPTRRQLDGGCWVYFRRRVRGRGGAHLTQVGDQAGDLSLELAACAFALAQLILGGVEPGKRLLQLNLGCRSPLVLRCRRLWRWRRKLLAQLVALGFRGTATGNGLLKLGFELRHATVFERHGRRWERLGWRGRKLLAQLVALGFGDPAARQSRVDVLEPTLQLAACVVAVLAVSLGVAARGGGVTGRGAGVVLP